MDEPLLQRIVRSRVDSTKLLIDSLAQLKKKPKVLLSASGVGFYGFTDSDREFDETVSTKGTGAFLFPFVNNLISTYIYPPLLHAHHYSVGFLATVCEQWEAEALQAQSLGIRTACLRFAPIFSKQAGILAKLLPIFSLGVGGVIGSGQQGFSWVSLQDVVRAIEFVLAKESLSGPINVCAPSPTTNSEFTLAMGRCIRHD